MLKYLFRTESLFSDSVSVNRAIRVILQNCHHIVIGLSVGESITLTPKILVTLNTMT